MSMQRRASFLAVVWSLCAMSALHVRAELATFYYYASVYRADIPAGHPLQGMIQIGDQISGSFQYDLSLPDEYIPEGLGFFNATPAGANRFNAAGGDGFSFDTTFSTNAEFHATVTNAGYDDLLLRISGDTAPSTLELENTNHVEAALLVGSLDPNTFLSDLLPSELNLNAFDIAGLDFFSEGTAASTFLIQTTITYLSDSRPGDFDKDTDIDDVDLELWKLGYGIQSGAQIVDGDADGDHDVDGSDFLIWQAGYSGPGEGSFSRSGAVPEPASWVLCLLASTIAFIYRRSALRG